MSTPIAEGSVQSSGAAAGSLEPPLGIEDKIAQTRSLLALIPFSDEHEQTHEARQAVQNVLRACRDELATTLLALRPALRSAHAHPTIA